MAQSHPEPLQAGASALAPVPDLYWWVLALSFLVALLPALWPELDFAVASQFLQPQAPHPTLNWWWIGLVNEHVPALARTLVALAFVGWGLAVWAGKPGGGLAGGSMARRWLTRYRRELAFVALAGLIGPGLLVSGLKDLTQRARPFHVVEFGGTQSFAPALAMAKACDDNCAFPSGHTSDGFFVISLMLLAPKRRWRWVMAGLACGLLIGFARIAVGAHWLSDVVWACPVTLVGSALAWTVLRRIYPKGA